MERTTPVRKPHTSTADLLTWSENPAAEPSVSAVRTHQVQRPEGAISKVLFGGQMTEEEAESLLQRKQCSGSKMREMTGSGIFAADGGNDTAEIPGSNTQKTGLRIYQQTVNAMSQISFSADEDISPKKPTSIAEMAKQRELSGNLESESEAMVKKQISDAKNKELSGHDIFGPPPEIKPRLSTMRSIGRENVDIGEPVPRNLHTSVKVSNPAGGQSNFVFGEEEPLKTAKKIHNQKFAELSGNDIFKGDAPPGTAEKPLSQAKLKEMSGSDIFADGKAASRDYLGGVRKPPGGESSIALV